jgi:hypothetical protein
MPGLKSRPISESRATLRVEGNDRGKRGRSARLELSCKSYGDTGWNANWACAFEGGGH